ncbi:M23 family metallopeptidase [Muricomes sp. OA1]|uniref:M23 family metallopeptidase n=1 Tax=Lachnospiraceae TaxID=186803 RepID=UPI0004712E3E|nr:MULTISPECIES: M23 family metallopeptidase [Clostridia]MCH1974047.1 M23 family metallopeptidase [Muricomes sp. OA1]
MKRKRLHNYILLNLLLAFFLAVGIHELLIQGGYARLNENTAAGDGFRRQSLNEEMLNYIQNTKDPGENLGLYWLETDFGTDPLKKTPDPELFSELKKRWAGRQGWEEYIAQCRGIWNDVKYFPVPAPTGKTEAGVSFVDSWMYERNYGGKRGHEGTDIMADKNERGLYPVVSMTDGVVRHKGWLEQGGWRLGIVAPGGAYFYYAHLDSYADIEEGDTVQAGDLLGYMGDTGYSKTEGTTGNFPVHLHVGIYLFHNDEEISVNPYWVLRYLEPHKIQYS